MAVTIKSVCLLVLYLLFVVQLKKAEGCEKDEDCFGDTPYCNIQLGKCVECLQDDHCSSLNCIEETGVCEDNGGWTTWGPWMPLCSNSVSRGQKRQRKCANPPQSSRGRGCIGDSIESRPCPGH